MYNNIMTLLFQNKYRIPSARHPEWDYTLDNEYFITICTRDREEYFGNIINEQMQLNDIGKIVADEWVKTPKIRKNVTLDEWVIMPNHFHGIIIICNDGIDDTVNPVETPRCDVSDDQTPRCDVSDDQTPRCDVSDKETPHRNISDKETPHRNISDKETPHRGVSTATVSPLTPHRGVSTMATGGYNPKWQPNSLGSIVNQFKSVCTKRIRKINPNFTWQTRFHDHIIRNEQSLNNIRNYIYNNTIGACPPTRSVVEGEIDRNSPENLWM